LDHRQAREKQKQKHRLRNAYVDVDEEDGQEEEKKEKQALTNALVNVKEEKEDVEEAGTQEASAASTVLVRPEVSTSESARPRLDPFSDFAATCSSVPSVMFFSDFLATYSSRMPMPMAHSRMPMTPVGMAHVGMAHSQIPMTPRGMQWTQRTGWGTVVRPSQSPFGWLVARWVVGQTIECEMSRGLTY
jgi:hypothetical protein